MSEQIVVPRRGFLVLALAAVHLVYVALGALEVRPSYDSPPEKAIAWYTALSGADSTFGFFAPFVGAQLRTMFEVRDRHGQTTEEPFRLGDNREVWLRVSNVVAMYWFEDEALRRTLSASLAGKVLAKHPEAESVAVRVDVLQMPTMEAYRAGERPLWRLHYRAKFVPHAKVHEPKEAEK